MVVDLDLELVCFSLLFALFGQFGLFGLFAFLPPLGNSGDDAWQEFLPSIMKSSSTPYMALQMARE